MSKATPRPVDVEALRRVVQRFTGEWNVSFEDALDSLLSLMSYSQQERSDMRTAVIERQFADTEAAAKPLPSRPAIVRFEISTALRAVFLNAVAPLATMEFAQLERARQLGAALGLSDADVDETIAWWRAWYSQRIYAFSWQVVREALVARSNNLEWRRA